MKIMILIAAALILIVYFLLMRRRKNNPETIIDQNIKKIKVTSDAFTNLGAIPIRHSGYGENISPDLQLSDLSAEALSIAIIMDDLDIPLLSNFNHWVVWNLPASDQIPENIPYGSPVTSLSDAIQGMGYGRNRYEGPKPPSGTHRYRFHVFVLDCKLDLDSTARKKMLLQKMKGHILQYGSITGWYPHVPK